MKIDSLLRFGRKNKEEEAALAEQKIRDVFAKTMREFLNAMQAVQHLQEEESEFGTIYRLTGNNDGLLDTVIINKDRPEECMFTTLWLGDGFLVNDTVSIFQNKPDIITIDIRAAGKKCGVGFSIQNGVLTARDAYIKDPYLGRENRYKLYLQNDGSTVVIADTELEVPYSVQTSNGVLSIQRRSETEQLFTCDLQPNPEKLLKKSLEPFLDLISSSDEDDGIIPTSTQRY